MLEVAGWTGTGAKATVQFTRRSGTASARIVRHRLDGSRLLGSEIVGEVYQFWRFWGFWGARSTSMDWNIGKCCSKLDDKVSDS